VADGGEDVVEETRRWLNINEHLTRFGPSVIRINPWPLVVGERTTLHGWYMPLSQRQVHLRTRQCSVLPRFQHIGSDNSCVFSGEDLQSLQPPVPKLVFRQHARDCMANYMVRVLFHHDVVWRFLQSTWIHAMFSIHKLLGFTAGDFDLASVRHDNIVSTVDAWVVDRLVLAHEHECDPLREFSENAIGSVDMVPNAGIC